MEALIIERGALPETIFSIIGAPRIKVEREAGRVILSPVINPDDYDNDTDYLKAIPGMMEKIMEGVNAPASDGVLVEEIWPDVMTKCLDF
jgi:hypothetical protein